MQTSVAAYVKEIIDQSPFISEMILQDIISYSNLARFIKPRVEALYGSPVSSSAIVMAARRYAGELKERTEQKPQRGSIGFEISMKTNIYDLNLRLSDENAAALTKLYSIVKPSSGDFLNITVGSHEISLSVSDKYRPNVDALIDEDDVIHRFSDLVAISIVFKGDFLQTPGIIYMAVRKLTWESVNIIELISTMNVLTFVVRKEESSRAYEALNAFLSGEF